MSTASSLSNAEVRDLFQRWGFAHTGGNGGHLVMQHEASGRRVQITAPGRSTPTPQVALRKAADIIGVPLSAFKRGPIIPERPAAEPTVEAVQVEDPPAPVDPPVPVPEPEPEPEPEPTADLGPSTTVYELLKTNRARRFRKDDIVRLTGLTDRQVAGALLYLTRRKPDEILRIARGVYCYNVDLEHRTVREQHEREMAKHQQALKTFTRVSEDCHGRVVLKDHEGELWVAIRVEPQYFPLVVSHSGRIRENGNGH